LPSQPSSPLVIVYSTLAVGALIVFAVFFFAKRSKSENNLSKKRKRNKKGKQPLVDTDLSSEEFFGMSVVGIDFGNLNSVVAVARNRGIDVICNETSNRATP